MSYEKTHMPPSHFGFLSSQQRSAIRKAVFSMPIGDMYAEINRQARKYGLDREVIVRTLPAQRKANDDYRAAYLVVG
jgi:hypothetical protein